MKNSVKILVMLLLVSAASCMTACTEPADSDMLVGRWLLDRATETVSTTSGDVQSHDLEGYAGQTLELAEDGVCCRVDRGDTTFYMWYLAEGRKLLLAEGTLVVEDYTIDDLTDKQLILSHAYIYYDSLTDVRMHCLYKFEYTK